MLTVAIYVVIAGIAPAILVCIFLVIILLGPAVVAGISPLVAVRVALVWVSNQRAIVLEGRTIRRQSQHGTQVRSQLPGGGVGKASVQSSQSLHGVKREPARSLYTFHCVTLASTHARAHTHK